MVAFDGSAWSPVVVGGVNGISGRNGNVQALTVVNTSYLAVGGDFNTAGSQPVNRFVFYNGTVWSGPLNNNSFGFDGSTLALHFADSRLYIGGTMPVMLPDRTPVGNFAWL